MANMANVRFPHHKHQKYNVNTPALNVGTTLTSTIQHSISNDSNIVSKKIYYQQKSTKNISTCKNDVQFNNLKPNSFLPSRNSQITSKHLINSCNLPSQKKKKNLKSSLKAISKDSKQFNKHLKPLQDISTPSQILSYALKNEVSAGLPHMSRQIGTLSHHHHDVQEQSHIRRLSFESSGFSCCKSFSTNSDDPEVSKVIQCYVIKLPGMLHPIHIPKCIAEKDDHDVIHAFPLLKIHIDHQLVRVKLPGMQNNSNSVTLCEEPWWLSPKETSPPSNLLVKQEQQEENVETLNEQQDDDVIVIVEDQQEEEKYVLDDDVEEEYESSHSIEIQLNELSVNPIVKLPHWSLSMNNNVKKLQKKEMIDDYYYLDNYFHATSAGIEFDKESPIVQLSPKLTTPNPHPRSDLPNLRIETNLKLNDDNYSPGSTVSTPVSEVSSSFSHISTYAESENTVFTEEEIMNETKSCNAPERRSPSVLSDFGSEQLTPVLEEEEEDSKLISSNFLSIEECREEFQEEFQEECREECQEEFQKECQERQESQEHQEVCQKEFQEECQEEFQEECQQEFQEEMIIDDSQHQEEVPETNTYSYSESENEDSEYQENQETQDTQDTQDNKEYVLPELRKIAEQLETLTDSKDTIRIRRQLEIISKDNYPDSLPLSNKWTMYFADTSVTKTNTRIISKNKYSSTLNPLFECTTVPELCSNLRKFSSKIKPSDMKTNANLSFFKGNIMPMWEDEANQKGGRFTICPPRNQLNSLWDSIVLLLAGETIDDKDLICGAVCARRDRGDRVELWISGDAYSRDIDRIRDLLSMELGHEMKEMKNVKYKKHLGKP
ncbi:unnamed protein product [Rhizophagus irregularis]|nr:unnamed protein product [Rhizophagus irregularis]